MISCDTQQPITEIYKYSLPDLRSAKVLLILMSLWFARSLFFIFELRGIYAPSLQKTRSDP